MEYLWFTPVALIAAISILNAATIRRPHPSTAHLESIALLIPVRNEEANIPGLLRSISALQGNIHVYILDDQSTDSTLQLLTAHRGGNITVMHGSELAEGWMGKPWALHQLYQRCHEEFVVISDADVRLQPDAITSCINELLSSGLDYISPYPQQLAPSFLEKLVQPLVTWTWFATVPLRIAEKLSFPSMAVANGQFMAFRRRALAGIDGFSSVRAEVLDDVELARTLIRSGFHGSATQGSHLATTRMYENFSQMRNGYGKSLWKAFGSLPGLFVATAFIVVTSVAPYIFVTSHTQLATIAITFLLMSRVMSARIGRDSLLSTLLHPIAACFLLYFIFYSLFFHSRITWKDRTL